MTGYWMPIFAALEESVKLQSHYAALLNQYDGGKRMTFRNADEWILRLQETKKAEANPMNEPMTLTERLYNPQYREPKDTDLVVLDTERTKADMHAGALALDGGRVMRVALIEEIKRLTRALEEANGMCRSAFQIAERDGAETNWNAFREGLRVALANQHAILHPKSE